MVWLWCGDVVWWWRCGIVVSGCRGDFVYVYVCDGVGYGDGSVDGACGGVGYGGSGSVDAACGGELLVVLVVVMRYYW